MAVWICRNFTNPKPATISSVTASITIIRFAISSSDVSDYSGPAERPSTIEQERDRPLTRRSDSGPPRSKDARLRLLDEARLRHAGVSDLRTKLLNNVGEVDMSGQPDSAHCEPSGRGRSVTPPE